MDENMIQAKAKDLKKRFHFPSFQWVSVVASPWILITIPVLLGGFWLVLHPEIILNNLNKPYALLAGPTVVASVLLGWLIVTFFKTIVAWCKQVWNAINQARKDDGVGAFFWLTIYIMMIASVLDSGPFYDKILPSVPYLGYVIALVFDMVAVNGMRARLEAKRMRDTEKGWLYLLAIVASTCSSIYANLYMSLDHAGKLPDWMTTTSPWLVILFPTMIIVMSLLADHLLEKTSTRLDVAQFEAREAKKLALMQARLNSEEARKKIDDRLEIVRRGKTIKVEREIFWKRWFLPAKYPEIQKIIEQMNALYEPQIQALTEQIKQQQMTVERTISEQSDDAPANKSVNTQVSSTLFTLPNVLVNTQVFTQDDMLANTSVNSKVFTQDDTLVNSVDDTRVNISANSRDDTLVNTASEQLANNQMTRQQTKSRRITVKLSEHQRDTDELETVNTSANKKEKQSVVTSINSGDAAKRIERILRKTPNISVTELAKKAEVSRGYASEKRADFLKSKVSA